MVTVLAGILLYGTIFVLVARAWNRMKGKADSASLTRFANFLGTTGKREVAMPSERDVPPASSEWR